MASCATGASPQQRSRPPCRGYPERRSGLRYEGLRADHGRTRPTPLRTARRQGIRRRLHSGRPVGTRRCCRHPCKAKPQGPTRHRRAHLRPAKPRRALLLKAETQPPTGNPPRQDRRQLPRLRPRSVHPYVDQAFCPHHLTSGDPVSGEQITRQGLEG